ncbi:DUF3500 domain-containing protein [Colwellia psychrerythraea]|uniref:DUF3500 domain-containing protein n=1 Tax=Colwellia psychrerythraea TaxID=28229 RepID=A0A099KL81_COLPS|nr:DUF3500 domain-containing protein [Colwellia psychrerythraea]KGJ90383.1 Protein of unknown function DUF3500 [Colwellia psychrerythraea]
MKIIFVLIAMIGLQSTVYSQTEYSNQTLAVKKWFTNNELSALAEKFVGISSKLGKQHGLFPVKSTGVSTQTIIDAGTDFLKALTPIQKLRTQFSVDDPEWRKWSNVDNGIYVRQGISFEEMTKEQKKKAWKLLQTSLSAEGVKLSKDIMKTDQTLRELNNDKLSYGEEKYFITIMGTPSKTEPWGWQLDGHHLVINYFILGDQVVVTPMFLGAEPSVTTSGKYIGNSVLQEEQDKGLLLLQSLNKEQQKLAIIEREKNRVDIKAEANKDNLVLEYSGIKVKDFNPVQKEKLIELIKLFVNNIRKEHAQIRMKEVIEHLDNTYFSWIGGTDNHSVFYYRIHSPVLLIEFDHQRPVGNPNEESGKPTRQHIHVIVRTPNGNDYGKDLLNQHLSTHKH